jgi:DNA polymerase-4
MDAFYASVEQRDNVAYRSKPLAVGYPEARGVVATASYEARKFGIHSAMPSLTAKQKCPELIFVPPRFEVYAEISQQIRTIFLEYTDLVEPLSLDEAFLDVTQNHKQIPYATTIAREIRQRILSETGLCASAGISYNKFLAKIASDFKKPNGFYVILPDDAEKFIEGLKIEQFYGIGKVTAQKMHEIGIFTGYDLKQQSEQTLIQLFGKAGQQYYQNARGIDLREVNPERTIKSVSGETTFDCDKNDLVLLIMELYHVAKEVMERIEKEAFYGKTITLKVKFADFKVLTRSRTLSYRIDSFKPFWLEAKELLKHVDLGGKSVRLLGLGVSNEVKFDTQRDEPQLSLEFPVE